MLLCEAFTRYFWWLQYLELLLTTPLPKKGEFMYKTVWMWCLQAARGTVSVWKKPSRWHLPGLQLSHLHSLPAEDIYKQYFPRAITPFIYCSFSVFPQHQQICRNYRACGARTTLVRGRHKNTVRLFSPTRQKFQGNLTNRRTCLLEKRSTGKLLLLLDLQAPICLSG